MGDGDSVHSDAQSQWGSLRNGEKPRSQASMRGGQSNNYQQPSRKDLSRPQTGSEQSQLTQGSFYSSNYTKLIAQNSSLGISLEGGNSGRGKLHVKRRRFREAVAASRQSLRSGQMNQTIRSHLSKMSRVSRASHLRCNISHNQVSEHNHS